MNEVEKLMQNANVEREFAYLECHRGRSSICCPIEEYEKDDECMGCINSGAMKKVYEYPPFTAGKQLELIKWIAHKAPNGLLINKHITDDGASMVFDNLGYESTLASSFISFEECLAKLINNLWQDLTEEEKQQIKEILYGKKNPRNKNKMHGGVR